MSVEPAKRGPPVPPTALQLARFGHSAATIRKALEARGWGMAELNQAMGKERGYASSYNWVNGKGAPTTANAQKIAKILNVGIADLVARDVPETTLVAEKPRPTALVVRSEAGPPVKRPEVLGFSVDDEGRARLKLDVTLPIDDAAPLLRNLLDMGFVMGRRATDE